MSISKKTMKIKLPEYFSRWKYCSESELYLKSSAATFRHLANGQRGVINKFHIDWGRSLREDFEVLEDNLEVGKLSKIIVTAEGIHSIMLCETAKVVNLNDIRNNIERKLRIEKINNAATLLLNSIRQRALIEINSM